MITINNVSFEYPTKEILEKISLVINEGEKVGIIGANGTGKTTLIKLIIGELQPTLGHINVSAHNIGYLKQSSEYTLNEFMNIISDKAFINNFLKISSELGISEFEYTQERLNNLSGGEKTKLALSYLLSKNPDMLILDEPTNHVDLESIEWLIRAVNNFYGTVVIISHDRYFLNKTINKIVELDKKKVISYFGDYDYYEEEKKKQYKLEVQKYETQSKQEKKVRAEIAELNKWANKGEKEARMQGGSRSDARIKGVDTNAQAGSAKLAKRAKASRERLEKKLEDRIEKPTDEFLAKFSFNGETTGRKCLIQATNLEKRLGNKLLFENSDFIINSGEKIGLIGLNGTGKTTLINMITETESITNGELWKSPKLEYALLTQSVFDLNENISVFKLAEKNNREYKQQFLATLANMGFSRDRFNEKIGNLSLGERVRIKIAELILSNYNLLLLDEPTNHLDLPNKLELERALQAYKGSIIIAGHDRSLLESVTDKLLLIENQEIKKLEYGFREYTENNISELDTLIAERDEIGRRIENSDFSSKEFQKLNARYYKIEDLIEQLTNRKSIR